MEDGSQTGSRFKRDGGRSTQHSRLQSSPYLGLTTQAGANRTPETPNPKSPAGYWQRYLGYLEAEIARYWPEIIQARELKRATLGGP